MMQVIKTGRLIDGHGGEPVSNAILVIEDGIITAVGRDGELQYPEADLVIDVGDKTVMPGLIDAHWHVGGNWAAVRTLRLALQRGITTIGSVSGGPNGCQLRDAIEQSLVRGCSRLVVGCIVNATNGHVKGRTADGPWEIRKAVREMIQAGADFIKTSASGGFWGEEEKCSWEEYTVEELAALTDEAHSVERPIAVHAHTQPGLNHAIEVGIDMIHHGAFIDEEALQGIAREGLFFIPTLRVTCQKNIDAWPDRPWMREEMEQAQPIHRAGVKRARELGIKVGLGTDGPGSRAAWVSGDATPWELMELVQCGYTPMEAIVAGTKVTAAALKIDAKTGTLEEGKQADILVVSGNPLDNVGMLYDQANIAMVLKHGVVEYADEEHRQYYQISDR